MLKDYIYAYYDKQTWDALIGDENHLLQCIVDCTKCEILKPPPNDDRLLEIESTTRWLCAALHKERETKSWLKKPGQVTFSDSLPLNFFFFCLLFSVV